jgi:hypothetical protein
MERERGENCSGATSTSGTWLVTAAVGSGRRRLCFAERAHWPYGRDGPKMGAGCSSGGAAHVSHSAQQDAHEPLHASVTASPLLRVLPVP